MKPLLRNLLIGTCAAFVLALAIFLIGIGRDTLVVALSQAFSTVQINPEVIAAKDISKGSVIRDDDVEVGYFPNLQDLDTFKSVQSVVGKIAPVDFHRSEHLHVSKFIEFEQAKKAR